MSIIRSPHNENLFIMNKTCLQDNRLSWKAKGIYSYIMSLSDNLKFKLSEIIKYSTDGKSILIAGIKELIKFGYCQLIDYKNTNIKIKKYDYIIKEPFQEFTTTLLPLPDILSKKSKKQKPKNKFYPNSPGGKLAQFMLEKIEENDPGFTTPDMGKWGAYFSKMIFIERFNEEEIRDVIEYIQSNKFWKKIILNPFILRAKYSQIKMEMINPIKEKETKKEQTREEKNKIFEEAKKNFSHKL